MNIDRLRYFSVIVETKNLRKASELIGINPGSLSKAMTVLESELSVKLIRPEGRGIEITDAGMMVYKKSLPLLEEYKRFSSGVKEHAPEKKRLSLKIGTFEVFSTYFLSAFFASEMPEHEVTMLELTPGEIEAAILEGKLECGLTYLPVPNPKLEFREIGQFNMSIWGIKDKWQKVPFDAWPFAVPTTTFLMHSTTYNSLDMWPDAQKSRTIKYGFELLESALQVGRLGLSVIHCPDFIAIIHNRYVTSKYQFERLPYPESVKKIRPIRAYLVFKKGAELDKYLEGKLAKFFRSFNSDSSRKN